MAGKLTPNYESKAFKVESEGNGARVLVTRKSDQASLFMQDEDAASFMRDISVEGADVDWIISQYSQVFGI